MSDTSSKMLYQRINQTDDIIETICEMQFKISGYLNPSDKGTSAIINL